jgi:hypothetical protein
MATFKEGMSMGVYINGMEMPEKTYAHCMLIKDIDGSVQLHVCTKNSKEISEWEVYDLVPIHPHGRLIDQDAILREVIRGDYPNQWIDKNELLRLFRNAPAIIPAEEGEKNV